MKTIIAGSRGIGVIPQGNLMVQSHDTTPIQWAVDKSGFNVTCVISGTAKGVDTLGEYWAKERGIEVRRKPADWNQFGKRAGYMRNVEMSETADALIALWDGESKGTKHMIDIAINRELHVFIYNTKTRTKIWYNDPLKGTE